MLKILDMLYLGLNLNTLINDVEDQKAYQHFEKKVVKGDSSCVWICFPGWSMPIERAQNIGFLPNEGTQIIYQGPMSVVGLTPLQTEESLLKLREDIKNVLKNEGLENKPLKFFWF